MKAFSFRLQTKLDISIRQEDIARENLRASLNVRDEIAQQLEQLAYRREAVEDAIRKQNRTPAAFPVLVASREFLPVLTERQDRVALHLETAEGEVEAARGQLYEQARETNTLEKLKNRQWQEYQREALLQEQKVIDEIALANHQRKRNKKI